MMKLDDYSEKLQYFVDIDDKQCWADDVPDSFWLVLKHRHEFEYDTEAPIMLQPLKVNDYIHLPIKNSAEITGETIKPLYKVVAVDSNRVKVKVVSFRLIYVESYGSM